MKKDAIVSYVVNEAKKHFGKVNVFLFGSRATGTYSVTSDYDFAFEFSKSPSAVKWAEFCQQVKEESPFLFDCDLILFNTASKGIREHIKRDGIKL